MDSAPIVALPKLAFAPMFSFHLALPLAFYLLLGFYAVFTGILYYHWSSYADDVKVVTATYVAYLAITLPLIIVMATSALIF
jgi:hypothetical protein